MSSTNPAPADPAKPGFFGKVFHWFHAAAVWVGHGFVVVFGHDAAQKFSSGAVALLETQLGQIARTAVAQAAGLESNTEKFAAAGTAIAKAAEEAGLTVTDSLKNMLIELAVQELKLNFGGGAPPASA